MILSDWVICIVIKLYGGLLSSNNYFKRDGMRHSESKFCSTLISILKFS